MYIHFNRLDDKLNLSVAINNQIIRDKEFEFRAWRTNMHLVLGGSEVFGECKLRAAFRSVTLYDNPNPFTVPFLVRLSTERLDPVFLSKPNEEPSYNKFYENLIQNELGPIKNGLSNKTNALFTSVSSDKNQFLNKQHLISDLSVFLLPRGLLDPRSINQSYVFLMHFKLFFTDFSRSFYENLQLFPLY